MEYENEKKIFETYLSIKAIFNIKKA